MEKKALEQKEIILSNGRSQLDTKKGYVVKGSQGFGSLRDLMYFPVA